MKIKGKLTNLERKLFFYVPYDQLDKNMPMFNIELQ